MKILHLVDEPWDSGITAYALQIALLQHKAGHAVTVGVRTGKAPEKLAMAKGLITAPFDGLFSLRRVLNRPWDLINAHTGRTHTWSVLTRALSVHTLKRSVPVVRTRGDARAVSVNPLSRFLYRRTAGFIAASAHIGRQFEEWAGVQESRLEIVYPSVDLDGSNPPLPHGRVGILGRLDPVKGHAFFLEAAAWVLKKRPEIRFYIAGKEAGVSETLLRNQADQLGISHAIEFLGFCKDARDFMRSCTIGVVASVGSEEISRACLEWMSVGRPVVATVVGSLPELVEADETGLLVPPQDSASMAEAILSLLDDSARAARFGHAAVEKIRRFFTPEVQLEKTMNLYSRVSVPSSSR